MDFLNAAATILAGGIALIVYLAQLRNHKKNAAVMIIMDIRHAESIISEIKRSKSTNLKMKNIMPVNNWRAYKNLFVSNLGYDDFIMLNNFFESCQVISDSMNDIRLIFTMNIEEKAKIAQNIMCNPNYAFPNDEEKKQCLEKLHNEEYTLLPGAPQKIILENIDSIVTISGSTVFAKIKIIAKDKN